LFSVSDSREKKLIVNKFKKLSTNLKNYLSLANSTDQLITILDQEGFRSVYKLGYLTEVFVNKLFENVLKKDVLVMSGGRQKFYRELYINIVRDRTNRQQIFFNPSYSIYTYSSQELQEILKNSDFASVNVDEFNYLKSVLGVDFLENFSPTKGFILTKSEQGVTLFSEGKTIDRKSLIEKPGLFIGAGDAFISGFIHNFLNSNSLDDAMDYGQTIASFVVKSGDVRAKIAL
jgi:sugar/nucleoside kinase (ribokinase family)